MNTPLEKQIDAQVGQNIRFLRNRLGLSQSDLAAELNVTFQQLQKYEIGKNRVSAPKMVLIARTLKCQITDLFDGVDINDSNGVQIDLPFRKRGNSYVDLGAVPAALRTSIRKIVEALSVAEPVQNAAE